MVPKHFTFRFRFSKESRVDQEKLSLLVTAAPLKDVPAGVADFLAAIGAGVRLGARGAGAGLALAAAKDERIADAAVAFFAVFVTPAVLTVGFVRLATVKGLGAGARAKRMVAIAAVKTVLAVEAVVLFTHGAKVRVFSAALDATQITFAFLAGRVQPAVHAFRDIAMFAKEDGSAAPLAAEILVAAFAVSRKTSVVRTALTNRLVAFFAIPHVLFG